MTTLQDLVELNTLNECAYECTRQSRWKQTTLRYLSNVLVENIKLQDDVLNNLYSVLPTTNFNLNERGHMRFIEAPNVRDRVILKTLMKKILTPSLRPCVIYDNYASLKDRGTSFARKRFEIMLRRYISKYGTDGYILLIDIKKYFENIDHDVLKQLIAPKLSDEPEDVIKLIHYIIDTSSKTDKGLNLGSEAPQIFAVYYLTPLDTFIKVVKGVKYYGRYMDDIFVIGNTKQKLKGLLVEIQQLLSKLKLEINQKKTHVIKLRHGFIFLLIKYNILQSGKILKRISHNKIVRERRRLKAFRRKLDARDMTDFDIYNCYKSWRGTIVKDHNACYKTLHNMDTLFYNLFPNRVLHLKKKRSEIITEAFENAETEDLKRMFI